ncbi:hypothetical protein M407DRAFT_110551 [Tulasnella calospora MUT 4182]|uniref:Uncharacterized protein n=1 Tax=Tulasnella calospora MUT 4182 TaxID=1051891 RepID=A0A0C3QCZ2_9AGAM|nr:hypothetical protein M407DRAFT_110551 [Tulasnella calospora MUT 4182]
MFEFRPTRRAPKRISHSTTFTLLTLQCHPRARHLAVRSQPKMRHCRQNSTRRNGYGSRTTKKGTSR